MCGFLIFTLSLAKKIKHTQHHTHMHTLAKKHITLWVGAITGGAPGRTLSVT